jgi:hypothetical protein
VVNINRNANKIDSFLVLQITARRDPADRKARQLMIISMTNTAPTTGYDDYVISNRRSPDGQQPHDLDVYTRLGVGRPARRRGPPPYAVPELGTTCTTVVVIRPARPS